MLHIPRSLGGCVLTVVLIGTACAAERPSTAPATAPPSQPAMIASAAPLVAVPATSIKPTAVLVSPHPVSPEQGFKEQAADQRFELVGDLTGMLVTGSQGRDVFINPVHGIVQVSGNDVHLLVVAPDAGGTKVFEEVRLAGERSIRGPDGVWRSEPLATDMRDLAGALQAIGPVKTTGQEGPHTVLAVDRPVEIGALGGVRATTTTARAGLQILVDAGGSPMHLRFEMGPVAPGRFTAETLEITVRPTVESMDIAQPSPWVRYVSERGYELLMPPACKPLEGTEDSESFDCQGSVVRVSTHSTADPLKTWVGECVTSLSGITGTEPDLEETLQVGTKTDGAPGQIATYRYSEDGLALAMSDGMFVHGHTGFDFVVTGTAERETIDRARFLQMLATWGFAQ